MHGQSVSESSRQHCQAIKTLPMAGHVIVVLDYPACTGHRRGQWVPGRIIQVVLELNLVSLSGQGAEGERKEITDRPRRAELWQRQDRDQKSARVI